MAGSTVVIDPPDGNMKHYLDSLERLVDMHLASLAPGHGPVIDDPLEVINWLINHRLKREARVVEAMKAHPEQTLWELTPFVYEDVDEKLHRLASRSLLAHLLKLEADGRATCTNERWALTPE
jgi:glyoxylase-like metal-dependent hydrolase (beta-lactamase superfamily II)